YMKTPILRVRLDKQKDIVFYSKEEADEFLDQHRVKKDNIKRHKGLGTSSNQEVYDSFGRRIVKFEKDDRSHESLTKVFHKKFSHDRKKWIAAYAPSNGNLEERKKQKDYVLERQTITEFVDKELIRHAIANCQRTLPHICDGQKESQRKVLYTVFCKNYRKLVKVAQLGGATSELTGYHYGEQNLQTTITWMAQRFVGSNNLPLLYNDGQFGSRTHNGQDAAD